MWMAGTHRPCVHMQERQEAEEANQALEKEKADIQRATEHQAIVGAMLGALPVHCLCIASAHLVFDAHDVVWHLGIMHDVWSNTPVDTEM